MDNWKQRFEDVVFEENGLEPPSATRYKELQKLVQEQITDAFEFVRQLSDEELRPNTVLMTNELWQTLISDPLFCASGVDLGQFNEEP